MQSDSLFRIASISKPITAITILKLCEARELSLDAIVFGQKGILNWYRPSSKGDKRLRLITVRHLLQHSGGWDRDQVGDPVFWRLEKITGHRGPTTRDELISYMMTRKLQFSPGTLYDLCICLHVQANSPWSFPHRVLIFEGYLYTPI